MFLPNQKLFLPSHEFTYRETNMFFKTQVTSSNFFWLYKEKKIRSDQQFINRMFSVLFLLNRLSEFDQTKHNFNSSL